MTDPATTTGKRVRGKDADAPAWYLALMAVTVFTAVLWVVQIVNAVDHQRLDRFGLRPRTVDGLEGLVTTPFLHASYGHLASNTIPFLLLGWVVAMGGARVFLIVTAFVVVIGGLATWAVAPSGLIVGARALVFGWLGYLLARAVFARKIVYIAIALLIAIVFGSLWSDLLPTAGTGVSWQGHLCGFLSGILIAWVLHPHKNSRRRRAAKDTATRPTGTVAT